MPAPFVMLSVKAELHRPLSKDDFNLDWVCVWNLYPQELSWLPKKGPLSKKVGRSQVCQTAFRVLVQMLGISQQEGKQLLSLPSLLTSLFLSSNHSFVKSSALWWHRIVENKDFSLRYFEYRAFLTSTKNKSATTNSFGFLSPGDHSSAPCFYWRISHLS